MKRNEILARQDRAVYLLLVLVGALGLAWSLWSHLRPQREPTLPASATHATAPAAPGSLSH